MKKLAVFASGKGSNFKTIYQKTRDGFIPAAIVILITDNPKAGAIRLALENDIPFSIVKPIDFSSSEAFGKALLQILVSNQVDWIVLAGYLKKIPGNMIDKFKHRIVNIHPALLPRFGGKGMYGMNVHQAVFEAGAKVSGPTVHLVNNEYDAGPIVLQRSIDIAECRSPQDIAQKVLAEEHRIYPEALKLLLENEYTVEKQRVIFGNKAHD